MAYINAKGLVLKNVCFSPQRGGSLPEKLADCYKQFVESSINDSKHSVIKQTVFISAESDLEYHQNKVKIFDYAKLFFRVLPPTSVIAQLPDKGDLIVEIIYMEGLKSNELIFKENELGAWMVIQRSDMKIVVASDLCQNRNEAGILQQSIDAFEQLQEILREEKMEFSDIIRQWNYIEQITAEIAHNNSVSQHYQIFNDVRSKFYQRSEFGNGFPAATGIGMDKGGIIIDFIAAKFTSDSLIVGLKNPVQHDAYTYSKEVLAENHAMTDFCQTTPKFERAKVIITPEGKWIFVSGTAAITGEVSMAQSSVELQTELTIQNILHLISLENLHTHGIGFVSEVKLQYLRAYVKNKQDIPRVMDICKKHFPEIPIACVVADVCRPELLVEIEGLANLV